ncbi:TPA: hypothetical protein ACX6SX_001750 [Photobacterium damselae]
MFSSNRNQDDMGYYSKRASLKLVYKITQKHI